MQATLSEIACFHCGEPSNAQWRRVVAGSERVFCCAGCVAIAQTIDAAGLAPFYARREASAAAPPALAQGAPERDAARAVAAGLVTAVAPGQHEAALLVEGLHCGACVWLIETWLARRRRVRARGALGRRVARRAARAAPRPSA